MTLRLEIEEPNDLVYLYLSSIPDESAAPGEPLAYIPLYRDINSDYGVNTMPLVLEDEAALQNKILNFMRCVRGTRLHHPTYGSNLERYLHEPCDDLTAEMIYLDMISGLQNWFPEIKVNPGASSVIPLPDLTGFYVTVTYSVPILKISGALSFQATR